MLKPAVVALVIATTLLGSQIGWAAQSETAKTSPLTGFRLGIATNGGMIGGLAQLSVGSFDLEILAGIGGLTMQQGLVSMSLGLIDVSPSIAFRLVSMKEFLESYKDFGFALKAGAGPNIFTGDADAVVAGIPLKFKLGGWGVQAFGDLSVNITRQLAVLVRLGLRVVFLDIKHEALPQPVTLRQTVFTAWVGGTWEF